jgi:beta-lactamase superfamily II metal-dependent hydrolase
MEVEGIVLNVGDGDAILIILKKDKESFLMLIDGGRQGDARIVVDHLIKACDRLSKDGPDLIVCTDYDDDHIQGLLSVVDHFGDKIKEFWIHDLPNRIHDERKSAHLLLEYLRLPSGPIPEGTEDLRMYQLSIPSSKQARFKIILESIDNLNTLLRLLNQHNIPHPPPFPGERIIQNWPEIVILGPTRDYYNEILGSKSLPTIINEQLSPKRPRLQNSRLINVDPCSLLPTTSKITGVNKVSIIIRIDCENHRLLFTGDAGIESFKPVNWISRFYSKYDLFENSTPRKH